MLHCDVLLTEADLTRQFLSAIEDRHLPEKFFYWMPLSVRAWLDLCDGNSAYRNFSRSLQLINACAADIAQKLGRGPLQVVSLGAGQGDKDLVMLNALRVAGSEPLYRPLDASQALLELALERAAAAGFEALGIKADVNARATAGALAVTASERRIYMVLGNSLGVGDPAQFLAMLRAVMRGEDWLLVDGELFDAQMTLAGYDNPINRCFAFAPLAAVGLEAGRDGELIFATAPAATAQGVWLVTKHFKAARQIEIALAGARLQLGAGEIVHMNASCKYAAGAVASMLARAGLAVAADYRSGDGRFEMFLARAAVAGGSGSGAP